MGQFFILILTGIDSVDSKRPREGRAAEKHNTDHAGAAFARAFNLLSHRSHCWLGGVARRAHAARIYVFRRFVELKLQVTPA